NRRRLRRLIDERRMTEVGLAKVDPAVLSAELIPKPRPADPEIPQFIKEALTARPPAWTFFESLAPSYRRNYIAWIMDAKKDETRERRLRESIALLEQHKKLGLK